MIHTVVWSAALGINATEVDTAGVTDPTVPKNSAGHYIFDRPMQLLAALPVGANISRARLNVPNLRRIILPYVWPLTTLALPGTNPNFADYRDYPFQLPVSEDIEVDLSNTLGAATENDSMIGWLTDTGIQPVPPGSKIFTMRATATITAVALAWTSGNIVFGQTLPAGTYGVVGLHVQSATAIAARLIFPGYPWRPGVPGSTSIGQRPFFDGRKGLFGVMGQFNTIATPQLELFCTAADTTQVLHLDLVQISNTPGM